MPQVAWPVRKIPCATNALISNASRFYVRETDRKFLPIGQLATYKVEGGSPVKVRVDLDSGIGNYRIYRRSTTGEDYNVQINPVASTFTLEIDAGVVVNYPSRPILSSPGMQANRSLTNPLRTHTYDAGIPRYTGSVEIYVTRDENAGIVESFIDQLYDQRNWFELALPGRHLTHTTSSIPVSGYDTDTKTITITVAPSNLRTSIHDENMDGWWVRVGARTGRIIDHDVTITHDTNQNPSFAYAHNIRIVPDDLITGTYTQNTANNFSSISTMRVRATSVSAMGHAEYSGAWVVEFEESDGL